MDTQSRKLKNWLKCWCISGFLIATTVSLNPRQPTLCVIQPFLPFTASMSQRSLGMCSWRLSLFCFHSCVIVLPNVGNQSSLTGSFLALWPVSCHDSFKVCFTCMSSPTLTEKTCRLDPWKRGVYALPSAVCLHCSAFPWELPLHSPPSPPALCSSVCLLDICLSCAWGMVHRE